MPWFPYFRKISDADIFVIMGHCQFEKNNFQNRFMIDGKWQTLRVKKGNKPIREKQYVDSKGDWETLKRKLPKHRVVLENMDYCISDNLLLTNTRIIKHICKELNISTKIVSDFPTQLKRSERLLEICKKYNATHYLSGPSGKNYLDAKIFKKANIDISYQNDSKLNKTPILECLIP
tara:strand:- start:2409 stop:2939 length:531 start_codon:yes stop_codon:yes gene_type:complete